MMNIRHWLDDLDNMRDTVVIRQQNDKDLLNHIESLKSQLLSFSGMNAEVLQLQDKRGKEK